MRRALEEAGWPLQRIEDACLVMSELVTNALLHGGGIALIAFDLDRDELRIRVADHNPALPQRQAQPHTSPTGRGLHLLDALCNQWGTDPLDQQVGYKQVWAVLRPQPLNHSPRYLHLR